MCVCDLGNLLSAMPLHEGNCKELQSTLHGLGIAHALHTPAASHAGHMQGTCNITCRTHAISHAGHTQYHMQDMQYHMQDTYNITYRTHAISHVGHMQYHMQDTCNITCRTHAISHAGHMQYHMQDTCNITCRTHAISHAGHMHATSRAQHMQISAGPMHAHTWYMVLLCCMLQYKKFTCFYT